jgi:hypothetical protein
MEPAAPVSRFLYRKQYSEQKAKVKESFSLSFSETIQTGRNDKNA